MLDCRPSFELREALVGGLLDLAITTEPTSGPGADTLFLDKLVWVGARGGQAYKARPLPVAAGCTTCSFRSPVTTALQEAGLEWRAVSEVSDLGAMTAMVQADLAVMTLLATTVPGDYEVIGPKVGLPSLPAFSVNLYQSGADASPARREFARYLREDLSARTRQVA
jgi:DNA-binding transcriptional LysR family regulator